MARSIDSQCVFPSALFIDAADSPDAGRSILEESP
jgi:hypothetical protein